MPRFLGIDYGRRRIGFALSDETGGLAMPLRVSEVADGGDAVEKAAGVCRETAAAAVVVGLPLNLDGTAGPMAEEVRAFAGDLAGRTALPVHLWDERLSSCQAERVLLQADVSRRKRRRVRDGLAAQIVLQGYLDVKAGK